MSALLPCPFCGGEAETDSDDRTGYAFVRCFNCGAQASFEAWCHRQGVPNAASVWQPIESAPKDGQFVLLTGGRDWSDDDCAPAVVGFWLDDRYGDGGWMYAYWDMDWRSCYDNPTHWMLIPSCSVPGA